VTWHTHTYDHVTWHTHTYDHVTWHTHTHDHMYVCATSHDHMYVFAMFCIYHDHIYVCAMFVKLYINDSSVCGCRDMNNTSCLSVCRLLYIPEHTQSL